jgi:hypothetical protein
MVAPACPDAEFVELITTFGIAKAARILGVGERRCHERKHNLEAKLGRSIELPAATRVFSNSGGNTQHAARLHFEIANGIVLVGGDAHYWPGIVTTAHKAFVKFCRDLKPKLVVMNGDILDGSRISRHAPIGWENKPSLIQELEASQERLTEIEDAIPSAKKAWPLGNHDARFESRLAHVAPEYARVHGFHLKDHFPLWSGCWSAWVNENTVIKHRWKGGTHAAHNNTAGAGKNIVTNHLHSPKVTPFSDYNGMRFGVDTGTLAEPYGEQFEDYTEDNPRNHASGFAVLTFHKSKLLWPEIVHVLKPGLVEFRGQVIKV